MESMPQSQSKAEKLEAIKADDRFAQLLKGAEVCTSKQEEYKDLMAEGSSATAQERMEAFENLTRIKGIFYTLGATIARDHGFVGGFEPEDILNFDQTIEEAKA
jgi:hypothetical protein